MKGTISSKGQITVPKSVRSRYAPEPGTEVEFELREDGALLRKKRADHHRGFYRDYFKGLSLVEPAE